MDGYQLAVDRLALPRARRGRRSDLSDEARDLEPPSAESLLNRLQGVLETVLVGDQGIDGTLALPVLINGLSELVGVGHGRECTRRLGCGDSLGT